MELQQDFFISYNHNERAWAEWIAWTLEEKGYSTIIQSWDFLPGSNFALEMKTGLERARRVLAVLSPHYLASKFAQAEWAAAFARDPTGEKRILVPVRVAEVSLSGLDATIVYVDFLSKDEAACRSELLRAVEDVARLKPSNRPVFPGASRPVFPGSSKKTVAPPWRSLKSLTLLIGILVVATVCYMWMVRRPLAQPVVDINTTRQAPPTPADAAKKPVGTLTLKQDHQ